MKTLWKANDLRARLAFWRDELSDRCYCCGCIVLFLIALLFFGTAVLAGISLIGWNPHQMPDQAERHFSAVEAFVRASSIGLALCGIVTLWWLIGARPRDR